MQYLAQGHDIIAGNGLRGDVPPVLGTIMPHKYIILIGIQLE